jgi:hypothetical protein
MDAPKIYTCPSINLGAITKANNQQKTKKSGEDHHHPMQIKRTPRGLPYSRR